MTNTSEIQLPTLMFNTGYKTRSSGKRQKTGMFECPICLNLFEATLSDVKARNTKSCGCLKAISTGKVSTTHGLSNTKLHNVWKGIRKRCLSTTPNMYEEYGGRGITICIRWLDFENFLEDIEPTYEEGLTIDRIDNDLGYSPENCRWTTPNVQSRNTRLICKSNKSGYRGVSYRKDSDCWRSVVCVNSKNISLGSYPTPLEAAIAYDTYVIANNLEHTINGVLNQKD